MPHPEQTITPERQAVGADYIMARFGIKKDAAYELLHKHGYRIGSAWRCDKDVLERLATPASTKRVVPKRPRPMKCPPLEDMLIKNRSISPEDDVG